MGKVGDRASCKDTYTKRTIRCLAYQCGFTVYSDSLASCSDLGNTGPEKDKSPVSVLSPVLCY